MGRHLLSLLWLGFAVFVLASLVTPQRALAQTGITPAPVICPAVAGDATTIARLIGESGSCSSEAATTSEYNDPNTARSSIRFQIMIPGDGTSHPRVFARDASGNPLTITGIQCDSGNVGIGDPIVTGVGTTIGQIQLRLLGLGSTTCPLYVLWENGDNDLSFVGATLRRNSLTGVYSIDDNGVLAGGGEFDGVVATTTLPGQSLVLERNGVEINDGETDDVGSVTAGTPVTLTYTVSNIGRVRADIGFIEIDDFTLHNVDPQSFVVDPVDPRWALGVNPDTVEVGEVFTFTITFTPLHPTDFSLRMISQISDRAVEWFVAGSDTNDDDGDDVVQRTQRIISNFMGRRAGLIVGQEPDLTKRLGRPAAPMQSLKDGPPLKLGGPVNISGEGTEHNNRLAFSSSLGQVLGSMSAAKRRRIGETTVAVNALGTQGKPQNKSGASRAMGDAMGLGFDLIPQPQPRLGLWAEGTWARVDDDTAKSDFGLLYIGADYRFRDGLVVGLIAQFDRTDEEDNVNDYAIEGKGWMVGPYVVARLSANLIFDARAAWGKSNNEVSPYNTYTDDFDGQRKLLRGRLTGDFSFGGVHIAPHVGVIYFSEEQKAYTDSNGYAIGAQTVELGRLTFGPKFSTSFRRPDGTTIAPFVAINGIWDFKRTDQVDIDTGLAVTGSDKFRARTEAGLSIRLPQGVAITGEGFYDGIGSDGYNAYGGSLKVGVPF